MKSGIAASLLVLLFSVLFLTGKASVFHIDGYVITEADHYALPDQIVEVIDPTGSPLAWFITNQNGLYSGDFEIDQSIYAYVTVEVSKTCDFEVVVYSVDLMLDNPYLVHNFLVCDFRSCRANFYYTQIDGDNLVFAFTDVSSGNITSWLWNFGDGQTSTEQHPVHQYNQPDHYDVILEITTDSCEDDRHKGLFAFQTDCLADFSWEQTNQGNDLMVHFTSESTGSFSHLEWKFGDGGGSNNPNPWHQYDEPGDYDVELHIWTHGGGNCNHSTEKVVRVQPASTCYALFTSVQIHSAEYEVQFSDTSIGEADTWLWNFGDETTSTAQHPLHVYPDSGLYLVNLEISGNDGVSSFSKWVMVQQSGNCTPDFSSSQPSIEEPLIIFNNLTTGDFLEYHWDFGDGTTSADTSPVHVFPAAGFYDVKLRVAGFGCADSITRQLEVLGPPPCQAAFSFYSQSPQATKIYFTNESAGLITSFQWNFGDGNYTTEENPVHVYEQWGNYDVWLKIDAIGCTDSVHHLVQIAEPEFCQAGYSFAQNNPFVPVVAFTNQSTGTDFTSFWDFGDGTVSEEENPVHDFVQWGDYQVWLKIETTGGCKDSVSQLIQLTEPEFCQAAFSTVQEYPQSPVITFQNESTGDGFSSFWDFGDGLFSEETHPQHTYLNPGQFSVLLTIETIGGCTDSVMHNIEILPPFTVSGIVKAGANLFGYGEIYLIKTDAPEGFDIFGQTALGDGHFTFSGLTPGSYLLQVVPELDFTFPVIPNYIPTYFGDHNLWQSAGLLLTSALPETVVISLLSYNDFFDGSASVEGKIQLLPDENPVLAVIFIIDENGEVNDYRVPDGSGNFSFDDIPFGKYMLYPEKAGKAGTAITIDVNEINPEVSGIVFIETADRIYPEVTEISETEPTRLNVYPNPADRQIQFFIPGHGQNNIAGKLSIQNISGSFAIECSMISGENFIDVSHLDNGIYFLHLWFKNEYFCTKLIIQHQ